jgi:hypothetical protein
MLGCPPDTPDTGQGKARNAAWAGAVADRWCGRGRHRRHLPWRVAESGAGDYARRGNKVFMDDGGDMGHEVVVLSGGRGRYQVLSAAQEPGVTPDPGWIGQNFSAPAAAEISSGEAPMAPWPAVKVLRAFGCQPGVHGSVISVVRAFNTHGWPCGSA